jgi:hypothetical protein
MKKKGPSVGSIKSVVGPPQRLSTAFDASSARPLFRKSMIGVTVADVLDVFPAATIVPWPLPIPAGHQALFDAARAARFPWLRLRDGVAIAGDEDGWRAWLEGFVSPADLDRARHLLDRGAGIVARATAGDAPVCPPSAWRQELSATFTSSPAHTCCRCGGREWRGMPDGDVCAVCPPWVPLPPSPYRWTKASEPTPPRLARVPRTAKHQAPNEAPKTPTTIVVPHRHRHECPGPQQGMRRAPDCRRSFPCTTPGCEQRLAYRCICCKTSLIERRSRRQPLAAALLRVVPR